MRPWAISGLMLVAVMLAAEHGAARSADPFGAAFVSCAVIVRDRSPGSFDRALAAAEAAGARNIHCIPPGVFFARYPERPVPSLFPDLSAELVFEPRGLAGRGLDLIAETTMRRLLVGRFEEGADTAPAGGEPIEDILLRVPPEIIRATTPVGPRLGSPGEILERGANQNSEFLIGSVLVNIFFPESISNSSESWTDEEIAGAVADLVLGIQQYTNRALWLPMSLRFIYNYKDFVRVPVSIEPIETNMATDHIWIGEALAAFGYVDEEGDALPPYVGAHALNNATRKKFKTDWVFTAFVADMSAHYDATPTIPDPGCWGGAGYVAYAYLGGPFLVIPYPACRYGYGLGFGRVFIHEMSHVFWALDEYVSGDYFTLCTERSGYLNVQTLNTLYNPAMCRSTPVPCIMQTASPPFESPLPICESTQSQVGLEAKELGPLTVPTIYRIAPAIEILAGLETDTLMPGGEYMLVARATNACVPNENSQQDALYRIDYAAPIVSGEIAINGSLYRPIAPTTGEWDSASEQIELALGDDAFEPGFNTIRLRVRNFSGLEATREANVFRVGLEYLILAAEPDTALVELSWVTHGEVFGAAFFVLRSDDTIGERDAVIAVVTEPVTAAPDRRAYAFADTLIRAGHRYRYRIVGAFEFDYRDEHFAFEFPSAEMSLTAPIPLAPGALVSNLLPNPTGGVVSFTVDVPMSYERAEDSRAPLPQGSAQPSPASFAVTTSVDIAVYNVLGQRLRTIFSGRRFGGYMSLTWDGTGPSGGLVPPGVYFLSVTAGGARDVRKVVIIR